MLLVKRHALVFLIVGVLLSGCTLITRKPPEPLPTTDVAHVSTGMGHTLFLTDTGVVWGVGENTYMQLGVTNASGMVRYSVNPVSDVAYTKTARAIMENVEQVATGDWFSLALRTDGTLWGWGNNVDRLLGIDTGSNSREPGVAPLKLMDDVSQISASGGHSLAVKQDGTLWGFGRNQYGQLAMQKNTGSSLPLFQPEQIMTEVKSVFAGLRNTFVIKDDNSLWSFGRNITGELGYAPEGEKNYVPRLVMENVKAVYPHEDHTMILDLNNQLWGVGSNSHGQLGIAEASLHTPRLLFSGVHIAAVGRYHTLLLKEDGSLWGMGSNAHGQLGLDALTNIPEATKVMDGVHSVYAALHHTIVKLEDGRLLGFGLSNLGQLGPLED